MRNRAGMTLVELLVVIAILGTMTAISSVAISRLDARHDADPASELLALRREAMRARRPVTRLVSNDSASIIVTALPDGRVAADTGLSSIVPPTAADVESR